MKFFTILLASCMINLIGFLLNRIGFVHPAFFLCYGMICGWIMMTFINGK